MCIAALAGVLAAGESSRPATNTPLARYHFAQAHMGTAFRIVLYAPSPEAAERAAKAAFARIRELDQRLSDYREDSELMQLCRQAGGPAVRVSEDTWRALAAARKLGEQSGGAFDITAGPMIRAWRAARREHKAHEPEETDHAMQLRGLDKLALAPATRSVRLSRPGMLLDLGGIAKGMAADEALAVLARNGIDRALVAAGGDIVAGDPPPGSPGWKVGIAPLDSAETPRPVSGAGPRLLVARPQRTLLLRNAAVSTSGDAEQHLDLDGRRLSHIIDPRTGLPLAGHSSVTVVAPGGILADALATAISVLGPESGLRLADSIDGASALFVISGAKGEQVFSSRKWTQLEQR